MSEKNEQTENRPLVLIVDDLADDIEYIGNLLRDNGYRVAATTDSTDIPARIKDVYPDLILLDVKMPEKNGFEVCKEIKAEDELKPIPVIFLTIKDEQQDINYGLKLGGADYITKPFNAEELLGRVKTHIELKQAKDKIARKNSSLQRSIATRDRLLSVISHDMRGVFFGINGLIGLVKEEMESNGQLLQYLELAENSTLVANDYLENLLNWSRMQTEELELEIEQFDLAEEIKKCLQLYRSQIVHKDIQIRFDPQPVYIHADRNMISTVVRNLISNAIKFSEEGGAIHIHSVKKKDLLVFKVKDEGIGMSEEEKNQLFKSDQQKSRKGTAQERGSGLGLQIVKDMLEKHQAEISVESKKGEGTTFEVRLPRELKD